MTFNELNLIEPIREALSAKGYTSPTPIQAEAIPIVLKGFDLLGCAQTGTGKTAAFSIPIIQRLHEDKMSGGSNGIKALVLTPTRELAIQINESFADYGHLTKLRHTVIFGGVGQKPQTDALRRGVDVLIATPGRLLDLINQGYVKLNKLEYFILDEADRMLDMGFIHDIKRLIPLLPKRRQTLFFSATMPVEIEKLANTILSNPKKVEVTPTSSTVDKIDQYLYYVEKNDKTELLINLLRNPEMESILVFTRTKHRADRVARTLNSAKVKAEAIHGNKSQNARQRALNNFKDRTTRVLIATDIAARGIDIDHLTHVINYELPEVPETYVHRIGRTGRAGRNGVAFSFCDADEVPMLKDIEKLINKRIPVIGEKTFNASTIKSAVSSKKDAIKEEARRRSMFKSKRSESGSTDKKRSDSSQSNSYGKKASNSNNSNYKKNTNIMRILISLLILSMSFTSLTAKERLPEYDQARRFSENKFWKMLYSTSVDPHWFDQGDSFWYEYRTSEGKDWYVVNPAKKSKKTLFDIDEITAKLTEIVKDPLNSQQLPIQMLEAQEDGRSFTFQITSTKDMPKDTVTNRVDKMVFYFSYDLPTRKLTHLKDGVKAPTNLTWGSVSPDGNSVIYAKDLNLYRMSKVDYDKLKVNDKDSTIVEIQLTKDGVKDFGFGQPYSLLNTDSLNSGKRHNPWGVWSPDSKHFAITLTDSRHLKDLWVINSMAAPRPTLESYKYQMPGEKESPISYLYLFELDSNSYKKVNVSAFKDQTIGVASKPRLHMQRDLKDQPNVWLGDNDRFFVTRSSRDLHRIDICSYTIGEDTIKPIIEERMNTYIELRPLAAINSGEELIHWSERDGWAHLYLYDGDGNLKNKITEGAWHVDQIVKVDEKSRIVYFLANGREKGENPYYEHLYRVNFDGSNLKQVTKGDFFHIVSVDDNAKFVVSNYSRVNAIPSSDLVDVNGRTVMTLEKSDFSKLFEAGYKFPEPFTVKADDGVTDLYGVMYKPFDFDSTKIYPIVDYVYPGPQMEAPYYPFTPMDVRTDRLAQAGFVVITVGNRGGHPSRSKWYHNYGYGNLRDYGLADQKYAIEQLADRHSYIDINSVGIHGHSGGGFMSTAALLQYPNFFKVAVSCAGNHDNRIYNRWWSETHHGVKEKVSDKGDTTFVYNISSNPELAGRLKGKLLLVHGDLDNNVHPANSMRVAEALIRANKRFDMLLLPQQRHGFGSMNEYFYWTLVDYFSEHLKGRSETSVDILKR